MSYTKPLPELDNWNRPFWDACKERRLIAQRCNASGQMWLPPRPTSPVTRNKEWTWVDLSGKGRISSFVVMHQKYFAGFADELPYTVVEVELDEGVRMLSSIVDQGDRELQVGQRVEVVFEAAGDDFMLPKFKFSKENV